MNSTTSFFEWLLPPSRTNTTERASVMEGSLSRNSTAMEKMPVLMPMPRPSESSAATTSAGLRRRLRVPYTTSRQRFAADAPRHIAPKVLDPGEAPQVAGLLLDDSGVAHGNGVAVRGGHVAMKGQFGFDIAFHRAAAEKFQKEPGHAFSLAGTRAGARALAGLPATGGSRFPARWPAASCRAW